MLVDVWNLHYCAPAHRPHFPNHRERHNWSQTEALLIDTLVKRVTSGILIMIRKSRMISNRTWSVCTARMPTTYPSIIALKIYERHVIVMYQSNIVNAIITEYTSMLPTQRIWHTLLKPYALMILQPEIQSELQIERIMGKKTLPKQLSVCR